MIWYSPCLPTQVCVHLYENLKSCLLNGHLHCDCTCSPTFIKATVSSVPPVVLVNQQSVLNANEHL